MGNSYPGKNLEKQNRRRLSNLTQNVLQMSQNGIPGELDEHIRMDGEEVYCCQGILNKWKKQIKKSHFINR